MGKAEILQKEILIWPVLVHKLLDFWNPGPPIPPPPPYPPHLLRRTLGGGGGSEAILGGFGWPSIRNFMFLSRKRFQNPAAGGCPKSSPAPVGHKTPVQHCREERGEEADEEGMSSDALPFVGRRTESDPPRQRVHPSGVCWGRGGGAWSFDFGVPHHPIMAGAGTGGGGGVGGALCRPSSECPRCYRADGAPPGRGRGHPGQQRSAAAWLRGLRPGCQSLTLCAVCQGEPGGRGGGPLTAGAGGGGSDTGKGGLGAEALPPGVHSANPPPPKDQIDHRGKQRN